NLGWRVKEVERRVDSARVVVLHKRDEITQVNFCSQARRHTVKTREAIKLFNGGASTAAHLGWVVEQVRVQEERQAHQVIHIKGGRNANASADRGTGRRESVKI